MAIRYYSSGQAAQALRQDPHRSIRFRLPALPQFPLFALRESNSCRGGILSDGQQAGIRHDLVSWGENQPETEVVVPVIGRVVVPVGRTAVDGLVVPAAAPVDTVGASFRTEPQIFQ